MNDYPHPISVRYKMELGFRFDLFLRVEKLGGRGDSVGVVLMVYHS